MSLETVFSSETKIQVLRTLSHRNTSFSAEELERETTKNVSVIYDALRSLKEEGVIKEIRPEGKKRYYRLHGQNEVSRSVVELFETERDHYSAGKVPNHVLNLVFWAKERLRNRVEGLHKIMLFGSAVRGDFTPQSDVDLYIVVEERRDVEDEVLDILGSREEEFSLILRSVEEYREEFRKPASELAKSLLRDRYVLVYGDEEEDEKMKRNFQEVPV